MNFLVPFEEKNTTNTYLLFRSYYEKKKKHFKKLGVSGEGLIQAFPRWSPGCVWTTTFQMNRDRFRRSRYSLPAAGRGVPHHHCHHHRRPILRTVHRAPLHGHHMHPEWTIPGACSPTGGRDQGVFGGSQRRELTSRGCRFGDRVLQVTVLSPFTKAAAK